MGAIALTPGDVRMRADQTGWVFASILLTLLVGGCATSGAVGSPAQSSQGSPPVAPSTAPRGTIGVGVGTGGVRVGGSVDPTISDPVMNSVMMGFIIGSAGGPIGSLVGAGVGYFHGLHAKKELEQQSQREADKLRKLDEELERQIILAQHHKLPAGAGGQASAPAPEQGVIVVEDHLPDGADRAGGSAAGGGSEPGLEPGVVVVTDHLARPDSKKVPEAGRAPVGGPLSPPPMRGPALARVPPRGVDRDGFRAVYEGGRLVRRERDMNGDGKSDVILHYNAEGQLVRREESSRLDGRIDTWTFYAGGKPERKESDTDGDGTVDLWAYYDARGDLVRLESLVDRGGRLTQFYADGKVVKEELRLEPGGQLQARSTYRDGRITEKEEDSSGNGQLDLVSIFDADEHLVKQGRKGGDGRISVWRYFDPKGTLLREEGIGKDGQVGAVSYYEAGRLVRRELYELDDKLFKRAPVVSEGGPAGGG